MAAPLGDYLPIACVAHERLEFAVLRRQRLRLVLAGMGEQLVLPTDVYTRDGAEWLVYRDDIGMEQRIRLDQIVSASPL